MCTTKAYTCKHSEIIKKLLQKYERIRNSHNDHDNFLLFSGLEKAYILFKAHYTYLPTKKFFELKGVPW